MVTIWPVVVQGTLRCFGEPVALYCAMYSARLNDAGITATGALPTLITVVGIVPTLSVVWIVVVVLILFFIFIGYYCWKIL
jgi:uncharacterized membrane protein YhaH (DUF805 family)